MYCWLSKIYCKSSQSTSCNCLLSSFSIKINYFLRDEQFSLSLFNLIDFSSISSESLAKKTNFLLSTLKSESETERWKSSFLKCNVDYPTCDNKPTRKRGTEQSKIESNRCAGTLLSSSRMIITLILSTYPRLHSLQILIYQMHFKNNF